MRDPGQQQQQGGLRSKPAHHSSLVQLRVAQLMRRSLTQQPKGRTPCRALLAGRFSYLALAAVLSCCNISTTTLGKFCRSHERNEEEDVIRFLRTAVDDSA
jgi:hypothetical protein